MKTRRRTVDLPVNIIFLITLLLENLHAQESCVSPNGSDGSCIEIMECEILRQVLFSHTRSQEETSFLRNSQCGYDDNNPKVCCPIDPNIFINETYPACTTFRNERGRCVEIKMCPKFAIPMATTLPLQTENEIEGKAFLRKLQRDITKIACPCDEDLQCICCADLIVYQIEDKDQVQQETIIPKFSDRSKLPLVDNCGKINTGPSEKDYFLPAIDQYPWNALIEYTDHWNSLVYGCGGTLITSKYVLTAGKCVLGQYKDIFGNPKNVRLGEFDRTWNDDEDCNIDGNGEKLCNLKVSRIEIKNIIVHPDYNPKISQRNDIALLELSSEAPYTAFIRPACLPSFDFVEKPPEKNPILAGWRLTDILSPYSIITHQKVPLLSLPECQENYTMTKIWEKQMCTKYNGKDSCCGDPGGPLIFNQDGRFEVHGVLSFGLFPCSTFEFPTVFTKVHSYLDWIYSSIEK